MRRFFPLTLPLLLGAALTWAPPAASYVPSVTAVGCNPLHWAQTCVHVTADSDGVADMAFTDVERIARLSVQSWTTRTSARSFLWLEYVPGAGSRSPSVDGWQVIKFREKTWCRPGDSGGESICYDPGAAALTTVSFVDDPEDPTNNGRIVDADIELNAVANYFYDADKSGKPNAGTRRPLDLWNTLTHELGHLQGLEHTCGGRSSQRVPSCSRDGEGQTIIACSVVDAGRATDKRLAAIYETTMYPSAKASETTKRTPENDDVAGIVALYPASNDPNICGPPGTNARPPVVAVPPPNGGSAESGGCATSSSPAPVGGWVWLTALIALCSSRRRRVCNLSIVLAHPAQLPRRDSRH